MIYSKTVFVLGAGASCDFRMPLGTELARTISQMMALQRSTFGNAEGQEIRLMDVVAGDISSRSKVYMAAQKIHSGLPLSKSIDDFMHLHREDDALVRLGKASIVKSVLAAERQSNLRTSHREPIDFRSKEISELWLTKLIRLLSSVQLDLLFRNVTFITFNYDRCLERFLVQAVAALHGVGFEVAAQVVSNAKIFHPYGTPGKLPEFGGDMEFGRESSDNVYVSASGRIRTYTEEYNVTEELRKMHNELQEASSVVFLGFAYHRQNMDLLAKCGRLAGHKKYYGTAYGMSTNDIHVFQKRISSIIDRESQPNLTELQLSDGLDCSKFFDEFGLTLSSQP